MCPPIAETLYKAHAGNTRMVTAVWPIDSDNTGSLYNTVVCFERGCDSLKLHCMIDWSIAFHVDLRFLAFRNNSCLIIFASRSKVYRIGSNFKKSLVILVCSTLIPRTNT